MESIKHLMKALIACNIINDDKGLYSYNGITPTESSEVFHKRLDELYKSALMDVPYLSKEEKEGLSNVINKYKEKQASFDVPNESHLMAMNDEISQGNDNPILRIERDFVKLVCECVSLQKYYLNEFASVIGYEGIQIAEPQQAQIADVKVEYEAPNKEKIIKGVKGLAEFLGCGINTAQNIINSQELVRRGIQYNAGRGWRFSKEKLTDLLEKEPELLKRVRKK